MTYRGKSVCVVVPAHNEEKLLSRVIETMPEFVDHIVVVDDASPDRTSAVAQAYVDVADSRVTLIRHEVNQGVGGAIVTGYKWARDEKFDIAVVMAGDAQMDPDDLPALLDPVAEDRVDYSKGNRLFTGDAWREIPRVRYLGNAGLSLLTKIASGYWHVADSQTGYTAINLRMLELIDWDTTHKRYGCPNDYLVRLNVFNAHVADVPIKPIYNVGEESGIRPFRQVPKLSWLLFRLFIWRLVTKYIIRDFHPLVFFYAAGFVMGIASFAFLIRLITLWILHGYMPHTTTLLLFISLMMSLQFTMFAMWFDMEANKDLRP